MMLKKAVGALTLAAAATLVPFAPGTASADPCPVSKIGNAGGQSWCGGGGTHQVKITCGDGRDYYGPIVRADGNTPSTAWCPTPFIVVLVDAEYYPPV